MYAFLAVTPFVLIFLLMTWGRRSADVAGALGWLYTAVLTASFFHTSWTVILLASLAGLVASFPISLMVATSVFQVNVMEEAGAIRRVVAFMKTLAGDHRVVQVMLINVGLGTVLAALGATPVSILPPIMLALGYSAFVAVALPAIGYDALCTYALLGVPVVVFADVVNAITGKAFTPADVGVYFAQYMPMVTSLIAMSMLWLVGGWREVRRGWHVALLTGITAGLTAIGMSYAGLPTLTGVVAGVAVIIVMLGYLKLAGRRIVDRSVLTGGDLQVEREMSLGRAILPWIVLIVVSVATNFRIFGLYDWLFNRWAMPVEIVPGKPERLRVLWQAYTWVLFATMSAIPFYRMTRMQWQNVWRKSVRRIPRPAFAAAVYFAIAFVLNHSGKTVSSGDSGVVWLSNPEGGVNMVKVLADASAGIFGEAYAGIAGFLGLLGGFISGSETSSIAMLSKLHFETVALVFPGRTPEVLLAISLCVAAASGIGGGLASVISPAKLQNASAVIDRIGLESQVIRSTVGITIVMVAAVALLTFIFLAFL
jgi:lactate permease